MEVGGVVKSLCESLGARREWMGGRTQDPISLSSKWLLWDLRYPRSADIQDLGISEISDIWDLRISEIWDIWGSSDPGPDLESGILKKLEVVWIETSVNDCYVCIKSLLRLDDSSKFPLAFGRNCVYLDHAGACLWSDFWCILSSWAASSKTTDA